MAFPNPTGYALMNQSKSIQDSDLRAMATALQTQLRQDFCPVWNVPALPVACLDASDDLPAGYWAIYFSDLVTEPDTLGYHTDEVGTVSAEIEIPVLLQYGCGILSTPVGGNAGPDSVSSVVSHEILEMTEDPQVSLWVPTTSDLGGVTDSFEVCDPVQESYYSINGVQVSDFVFPAYFIATPVPGARLDQMGILTKPFEVAPGGYMLQSDASGNVTQVYGVRPPSALRMSKTGPRKMVRMKGFNKSLHSLTTPTPFLSLPQRQRLSGIEPY